MNNTEKINHYINDINRLLPYSDSLKKDVIDELKIDVQSAMEDSNGKSPEEIFGNPLDVAKNICESQNWHKNRANWWIRFFAWIIDLMVKYFAIFMLMVVIFLVVILIIPYDNLIVEFSKWEKESFEITLGSIFLLIIISITTIIAFSFMVVYNIILEGRYSTTIGKKIFNLIVVDQSGCKLTWKQAIIRNLSKVVSLDFVPFIVILDTIIGIVIEKVDPTKINKQRGFDLVAESIVIKKPSKGGF